jgi:hypothetical protein
MGFPVTGKLFPCPGLQLINHCLIKKNEEKFRFNFQMDEAIMRNAYIWGGYLYLKFGVKTAFDK